MSKVCEISGHKRQVGHRVSHANNKRKHVFEPNLVTKKLFVSELGKTVRVRISTRVLRTIDKIGLSATLKKYGKTLKDLTCA